MMNWGENFKMLSLKQKKEQLDNVDLKTKEFNGGNAANH